MSRNPADEIARLREEIRHHDRKYFVEAAPEISDPEYNRLVERLKKLEAEHPELVTPDSPTQRVGEQPVEGFPRVEHRVPMLSIENANSIEELKKFGDRTAKLLPGEKIEWVVELKIDGVAVALIYENGVLVRGVTRGDGRVGDDVTPNIRTVGSVPLRLAGRDVLPLLEVRGEVYMTNSDLVAFNQQQKKKGEEPAPNTRNLTAGSIRLLDPRICAERRLRFFCHSVGQVEGLDVRTHMEFLERVQSYGLAATPEVACFGSFDAAVKHCEQLIERLDELDFEIDGLVLKVNSLEQRERLGATPKSPRWVIAYKFKEYSAPTRLKAIRVQVGKTGAITPVADLEPVEIAGVMVSRASLHNADEIERKDVREGDFVIVERAGKVIPHILRVEKDNRKGPLRKFVFPDKCPECGTRLVKDEGGVYIRCPNTECPAQVNARILYYAGRSAIDIDGLGDELVKKLVAEGLVRNYGDLYRLNVDQLTGLEFVMDWGQTTAEKIVEGIERSKTFGLAWLLGALSTGQIREAHGAALARHFRTMEALLAASRDEIARVSGIGPVLADSIHQCLHEDIGVDTIAELKNLGVSMEDIPGRTPRHDPPKPTRRARPSGAERYGPAALKKRITYYANGVKVGGKKRGIAGLGETRVDQLVDEELVRDYADLYRLSAERLAPLRRTVRITEKEAKNQLDQIARSKDRGLARLLNALAIRHVGVRVATLLAEHFRSIDALQAATVEELSAVHDIGPIIAQSVYDYLHSPFGRQAIEDLRKLGVKMESVASAPAGPRPLEGKTFVVTGTLKRYTRDEIHDVIERHGGRAASSVSKNTDYLLAGEEPGSKLEKARELGVPLLSEEGLEKLLRE